RDVMTVFRVDQLFIEAAKLGHRGLSQRRGTCRTGLEGFRNTEKRRGDTGDDGDPDTPMSFHDFAFPFDVLIQNFRCVRSENSRTRWGRLGCLISIGGRRGLSWLRK